MDLSVSGQAFDAMRTDFDDLLERTVANMDARGAGHATMTLKLGIELEQVPLEDGRTINRPSFRYDIQSVMQLKERTGGTLTGNYEVVCEDGTWVIRPVDDGQINIFEEIGTDGPEEPEGSYEWMKHFLNAEKHIIRSDAMTALVADGDTVLLSDGALPDSELHCSRKELVKHIGHAIQMSEGTDSGRACILFTDGDTGEVFHRVYAEPDGDPHMGGEWLLDLALTGVPLRTDGNCVVTGDGEVIFNTRYSPESLQHIPEEALEGRDGHPMELLEEELDGGVILNLTDLEDGETVHTVTLKGVGA